MERNLTGLNFKIGTLDGEYPEGSSITDSFFELLALASAGISSISYSNQQYAEGWSISGRKITFPFSTSNGSTVFINLNQTFTVK
jgi:hypothetical protein